MGIVKLMSDPEPGTETSDSPRAFFGRPDLVKEVHLRSPLPVVVPLVALVALGLVAIGFSRLLLGASREAAIVIAIVAAVSVLGAATFIAVRPRLDRTAWLELAAIIVAPVLIAAGIASVADRPPAAAPVAEEAHAAAPAPVEVGADGLAFDTDEITLTAEAEVSIAFDNQDLAPHNIAIYPDEEAGRAQEGAIFDGPDIQPGGSTVYEFTAPAAGTYYFQCDLHPDMNGTVTVE